MAELIRKPVWAGGSALQVLVEAADWSRRHALSQVLEEAGYQTVACPGPSGADDRCRLAAGDGCAAAEQADVVVHTLHPGDPRNIEALAALRRRAPGTAVVVELPEPILRSTLDRYEGCILVAAPMSPESLIDAVQRATHPET